MPPRGRAEGQPLILVADDDPISRQVISEALHDAGFSTMLASDGKETLQRVSESTVAAVVDLDMPPPDGQECLRHIRQNFPGVEVLICTGSTQVSDAVEAMKNGAFDYLSKPVNLEELVELVRRAAQTSQLKQENQQLRQALSLPDVAASFVGRSPAVREVLRLVEKVAPLESTVMITGESGAGKGLLARVIHQASPRRSGPFMTVSCTALPRDLVEAELFGHEKGAFTGAYEKRPGRVEMAHQGTLFLDEVGDLPIDLQPKLLSFLQERTFQRIGGNRSSSVDVRIIAATHQDLKALCREKKFREDLYFRLNVLPLTIPPLRQRREDLQPLCEFLLKRIFEQRKTTPKTLSTEALKLLEHYPWPGNVRELENVLERVTAFCEGDAVTPADMPHEVRHPSQQVASDTGLAGLKLSQIERMAIIQTLEMCQGNKSKAARRLGISEKSIYNKMRRLEIR